MAENDVKEKLKGLPMGELIGAPLRAVCDAQLQLAQASFEFINKIGFKEDDGKTNMLEFDVERPYQTQEGNGQYEKYTQHVQAPLLGLVPIPSLLIEDTTIDFQMEVSSTEVSKDSTTKSGETKTSANIKLGLFGKGSFDIQGKVSSSRENTRSTNQSAKYQVHVYARQQSPTEGMSRLMDILADCTTPLPSSSGSGSSEQ